MPSKILFMIVCLLIGVMVFIGGCTSTGTSSWEHKFKVLHDFEKEIEIRGKIFKPEGKGPFPAVVLLHGCGGIISCDYSWADKLVNWGYVAFIVDSLGPRHKNNVCNSLEASPNLIERAIDAHGAKSYLKSLSFIVHDKIAVMGWSHGGMAAANAILPNLASYTQQKIDPFSACISFYPYCVGPLDFNAPILVLIGEKDNWTLAEWCSDVIRAAQKKGLKYEQKLSVYKDAHHRFDCNKFNNKKKGKYIMHYNSQAEASSIVDVKQFLDKYLK